MNFDSAFEIAVGDMQMDPDKFWLLTFAEFEVKFDGFIRNRKQQIKDMLYQAWHTAVYYRCKDMPKLESIMIGDAKPVKKRQTDDEMIAKARLLNALFGGTEVMA